MNAMDAVEVTVELASPSMSDAETMELILWGAVLRSEQAEPFTWAYKYTPLAGVAAKIDSYLAMVQS
jgi:hypothetical protein